jgi:NAD(P)-dependent dehydrogenase (short-subunit alcohol dehydrogenase family)
MAANVLDLSGKVALITGGSRGLGRHIAEGFAQHGAHVIVASRKQDACEELAHQLAAAHGVKAWGVAANVSHWNECDTLVERAYDLGGRVDILVNNAGLSPLYTTLADVTEALYDKTLAVNLKGPFRLSAAIGARMYEAGGGAIINISSTASLFPTAYALPYAMAKAGLNTLTLGLIHAYGPAVRVNTIVPGPFNTDIAQAWDSAAFQTTADATIAMRRAGEPEEIVGAALYLASAAASYTTGALLRVDGGVFGTHRQKSGRG